MSQSTPWAILLTKWNDHAVEPKSRAFYENLFTTAGVGTFNMTDYFETMSHGSLDVSGCHVHGWFTLDQPQTAYVGNATPMAGQIDRTALRDLARTKAAENGVDLSQYYGVVVVMNTSTDLCGWIGGRAALCDFGSCQPTVLGQEMGHGYGLLHSRVDGSTADYQDPWDTMSTWDSCFSAANPDYTLIGPGLNAANMRSMGWLDETRVWHPSTDSFSLLLELRPLHRRDLPGNLVAELPGPAGGYLVEFRVPEDWDEAFPRAAVFVHRLEDGRSYRMHGAGGRSDLVVGDTFRIGNGDAWDTRLEVIEINTRLHYAKITLARGPGPKRYLWEIDQIFGGVAVDGGGVIVIGGVPHPVGPWGPMKEIAEQVVAYRGADAIVTPLVRLEAKKSALARIVETASAELEELTGLESPPPLAKRRESGQTRSRPKRAVSRARPKGRRSTRR